MSNKVEMCQHEDPLCVDPVLANHPNAQRLCQNHWVKRLTRWQSRAFYVQDSRDYVGNCVLWWRPQGNGYTCHLDLAGLYVDELRKFGRATDIKWRWATVEVAASRMVDIQRLERSAA